VLIRAIRVFQTSVLTALQPLISIAPVMGVSRQAGGIISGAGWPARWGCCAEWVFRRTLSLCRPNPTSNLQA